MVLERGHLLWHQAIFLHLKHIIPSVQYTPVDVLIDAICVQDKTVELRLQGYTVIFGENGRRVNGKPTSNPYAVGDSDALCVFAPSHKYIFSIPSAALAAQGQFEKGICSVKKGISC